MKGVGPFNLLYDRTTSWCFSRNVMKFSSISQPIKHINSSNITLWNVKPTNHPQFCQMPRPPPLNISTQKRVGFSFVLLRKYLQNFSDLNFMYIGWEICKKNLTVPRRHPVHWYCHRAEFLESKLVYNNIIRYIYHNGTHHICLYET